MSSPVETPLRILLLHRPGQPRGGVESHVGDVADLLRGRGHAVEVRGEVDRDRPLGEGFDLVHVHHGPLDLDGQALPGEGAVLRTLHDLRMTCPGANRLDRSSVPCERPSSMACALHGMLGHCSGLPRWPRASIVRVRRWQREHRRIRGRAPLLVASEFMRSLLLREGHDGGEISCVPYPVATPDSDGEAPSRCRDVVFAGRLVEPDKGLAALISVIERSPRELRFLIVGSGPAEGWLDRRLQQAGVADRTRRLGALDGEEARATIARAAVVVLPSRWPEPSGLVGLEALARGRPVVAFDVGGVGEWLRDGEGGFLVPAGDVDGFAARLGDLHATPELRDRLGRIGRAQVRVRHDPSLHVTTLERHYRGLIARTRAGRMSA